MKEKKGKLKSGQDKELNKKNLNPDDSIRPVKGGNEDEAKIYAINKRGKSLNRKQFINSAASVVALSALGSILKSCEESELDIIKNDKNCDCHAVCTCNNEVEDGDRYDKGDTYESQFDNSQTCICDTVCTCNSVCTCDSVSVCDCDSDSGGGSYYYTYWYPC